MYIHTYTYTHIYIIKQQAIEVNNEINSILTNYIEYKTNIESCTGQFAAVITAV